ncbi:MAG: type II toxin-antitoxin system HicB family antitoxin [Dehalococcoidia bacterium]|nr:type II toxin-antitoxin system HicB family antitoxin [Dehalococcoidia bacterium]
MKEWEYTVVALEDEDGGYWADVPALPGTGSQGETLEEAIENTKEAIALMIEYLRERGETIPEPKDVTVKVKVAA